MQRGYEMILLDCEILYAVFVLGENLRNVCFHRVGKVVGRREGEIVGSLLMDDVQMWLAAGSGTRRLSLCF